MDDTSGFYKLDGELLFGKDVVLNTNYELYRETHEQNDYPVGGWYWFESRAEACKHFGLSEDDHGE
jgi:hypothetical protein